MVISFEGLLFEKMDRLTVEESVEVIKFLHKNGESALSAFRTANNFGKSIQDKN